MRVLLIVLVLGCSTPTIDQALVAGTYAVRWDGYSLGCDAEPPWYAKAVIPDNNAMVKLYDPCGAYSVDWYMTAGGVHIEGQQHDCEEWHWHVRDIDLTLDETGLYTVLYGEVYVSAQEYVYDRGSCVMAVTLQRVP